ncbi:hypothetical protein ARAM_003532 [Aspergillus rambellii]|uniref:SGNH hydrolase-type esterase domain-containing protein n=1 Tax=Aspergillus rambellii TaxID=308745 RepID=A0A0F8VRW7_9EURO|nr:hypothetical protein ARAM_003532 [Aspergillus rambellii]
MRPSVQVVSTLHVCLALLVSVALLASGLSLKNPSIHADNTPSLEARSLKEFPLRVMPLGASITLGYRSTGKNGYRKWIRQQLRYIGWEVDMVGSLKNGTMKNKEHEGHFGFRIDHVARAVENSTWLQPNLILLNLGTNDAVQKYHVDTAGDRIDALLTELFNQINGTTIILSTLLPNTKQPRIAEQISRQYRNVAARRRAQGDRVVLAEMSYFIKSDQLADGTHPTDSGYKEMASVWWAAIQEAEREGMLQAPNNIGEVGVLTQAKEASLDDSITNPNLPDYTAPAQPVVADNARSIRPCRLCLVAVIPAVMFLLNS